MQDTKLFETILGIPTPWHVARVELKPEDERVDVWLEHEPTRWPCPNCGETVPAFDHAAERTWRHLDTCQFQTHLHAEIPRVQCPTHGVKQVRVPWAEPRSRFTGLLERLIIDLILQCSTVKGACEIAGVSCHAVRRRCQPVGATRPDPPPRAPHHPSASCDAPPHKGAPLPASVRGYGPGVWRWSEHCPSVRWGSRPGHRTGWW